MPRVDASRIRESCVGTAATSSAVLSAVASSSGVASESQKKGLAKFMEDQPASPPGKQPDPSTRQTNIHVAVRVRPFDGREKQMGAQRIVFMDHDEADDLAHHEGNTIVRNPAFKKGGKQLPGRTPPAEEFKFHFDHVYDSHEPDGETFHSQHDVHGDLGTSMLEAAWHGFNCSMFAYGQTGSGKTYSVMGTAKDEGLVPRFCRELFVQISQKESEGIACRLTASYIEIYNEHVYDLLDPKVATVVGPGGEPPTLKVREHPRLGPYVEGLKKAAVDSYETIASLIESGNATRHTAATKMNAQSSRSHALFILELVQVPRAAASAANSRKSIINLVDLAGSERSGAAGTSGARMEEGVNINKSLATLGRCINALAQRESPPPTAKAAPARTPAKSPAAGKAAAGKAAAGGAAAKKPAAVVPYRDSVLTWLLRESLGGNAVSVMLATVSPADINFDETLSTLRYADAAKRIVCPVKVNKDNTQALIAELSKEIEAAKAAGKKAQQLQDQALLDELQKSWEQKVKETEEIMKLRQTILADHGLSVAEMQQALGVKEEVPTLINLNEDTGAGSDENLVYFLKPGTTVMGSDAADADGDGVDDDPTVFHIQLPADASVLRGKHVFFQNTDGNVTVTPAMVDGRVVSKVSLNGKKLAGETALAHKARVVIADRFFFRYSDPRQAAAQKKAAEEKKKGAATAKPKPPTAFDEFVAEARARRLDGERRRLAKVAEASGAPPEEPKRLEGAALKEFKMSLLEQWDNLPAAQRDRFEKVAAEKVRAAKAAAKTPPAKAKPNGTATPPTSDGTAAAAASLEGGGEGGGEGDADADAPPLILDIEHAQGEVMATKLSMMRTFTRASLSGQAKPKADASSYVDELEVEIDTARGLLLPAGAAHLAADVLSLVCLVPLVTIHGPAVAAALGCREHADFEAAADEDEGGEVGADAWCDAHGGIHAYAALAEAGPAETLVHLLAATVCVCLLVQVSARLARRLVGALGLSLPVCCLVAYRKGDHPRVERRNSVGLGTGAKKPQAALLPSDLGIVALDPPRCACGFFAPPLALALAEALVGVYVLAWLAPEFDDDGAGAAARAAELAHAVVELPPSDSATLVCAVALFCLAAARIAVPPAAATLAAAWRVVTRCLGWIWAQLAAFGAMVGGCCTSMADGYREWTEAQAAYAAEQAAAEAERAAAEAERQAAQEKKKKELREKAAEAERRVAEKKAEKKAKAEAEAAAKESERTALMAAYAAAPASDSPAHASPPSPSWPASAPRSTASSPTKLMAAQLGGLEDDEVMC